VHRTAHDSGVPNEKPNVELGDQYGDQLIKGMHRSLVIRDVHRLAVATLFAGGCPLEALDQLM